MNNNRRKNFRPRSQKNGFRRRSGSLKTTNSNGINNNGNIFFSRNGSMNNIHNVEKTMQKYHQLAKDAQSNGDPILSQNYLQHADHYLRRYNELNTRRENSIEKPITENKSLTEEENQENFHFEYQCGCLGSCGQWKDITCTISLYHVQHSIKRQIESVQRYVRFKIFHTLTQTNVRF